MNRRDIVIGLIVLAVLGGIIYFTRQPNQVVPEDTSQPQQTSIEDDIEGAFNVQIPEDVERAELAPEGDSDAAAIATRDVEGGRAQYSVLADLPDPEEGRFYQAWLISEDETILLGNLRPAKGGFLIETMLNRDVSGFDEVVITSEATADQTPEQRVLQGRFQ